MTPPNTSPLSKLVRPRSTEVHQRRQSQQTECHGLEFWRAADRSNGIGRFGEYPQYSGYDDGLIGLPYAIGTDRALRPRHPVARCSMLPVRQYSKHVKVSRVRHARCVPSRNPPQVAVCPLCARRKPVGGPSAAAQVATQQLLLIRYRFYVARLVNITVRVLTIAVQRTSP